LQEDTKKEMNIESIVGFILIGGCFGFLIGRVYSTLYRFPKMIAKLEPVIRESERWEMEKEHGGV
jgi:hypothetical protein